MRGFTKTLLAGAFGLALAGSAMAQADKPLTILESVPGLNFPFFVHMMNQMKAEAEALGNITVIESGRAGSAPRSRPPTSRPRSSRASTASSSARSEVDAMAPALQQAVDAGIPVVTIDRRVDKVPGILAHVGADNVKGGEAQGELIMKLFPDGANIINLQGTPGASPAIDRNKGLHNVLDPHADKYKFVFEQTANFRRADGLSVTEVGLGGMDDAAGRHRRRQRRHDPRRDRGAQGAQHHRRRHASASTRCPRRWSQVRDGSLTATVEQFPGGQSRGAVQALVEFLREGTKPEPLVLLTPIVDHQGQPQRGRAHRRGEVGMRAG